MAEASRIAVDEIVELAAAGVLRALDARSAALSGKNARVVEMGDLVKSGFFVDIVIRAGGFPGPIDILGQKQFGQG